jgi:hypothetical protein
LKNNCTGKLKGSPRPVNVLKNDYGISVKSIPASSRKSKSRPTPLGACLFMGISRVTSAIGRNDARVSQDQNVLDFVLECAPPAKTESCIIYCTSKQAPLVGRDRLFTILREAREWFASGHTRQRIAIIAFVDLTC